MAEKMSEAAKAARREYKRKWNQENKDKLKAYQARFWEKKAKEGELTANEQDTAE